MSLKIQLLPVILLSWSTNKFVSFKLWKTLEYHIVDTTYLLNEYLQCGNFPPGPFSQFPWQSPCRKGWDKWHTCFPLGNLDSGSFCIWDMSFSINQQKYVTESDIPLAISVGVIPHWPSAGTWHCICAASYTKPLEFGASTGYFVLLYMHLAFLFSQSPSLNPCFSLVCIRGSDWPGINLLFSFLTPAQIENQYFSKKGKKKERSVSTWGLYTLLHNIMSGTWDPFPIPMTKSHRKPEFFSRVYLKSMSSNETTS